MEGKVILIGGSDRVVDAFATRFEVVRQSPAEVRGYILVVVLPITDEEKAQMDALIDIRRYDRPARMLLFASEAEALHWLQSA